MSEPSAMSETNAPPPDLLAAAKRAHENAYAPYSGFHVGAALRAKSGTVYAGANIENASYGLGRCAEQSAVQAMASAGERHFSEIVVYTTAAEPASPCGACRQVLFEFAEDAAVYLVNDRGTVRRWQVKGLLPGGFRL
jgi:cytidine deaminase